MRDLLGRNGALTDSFSYKVRGTCATAISKILLEAGQQIVDLSSKLRDRFIIDTVNNMLPDGLIIENKHRNGIECRGHLVAVNKFLSVFLPRLHSPFILRPVITLHAILLAEVLEITRDTVKLNLGTDFPESFLTDRITVQEGQLLLVSPVDPPLHRVKRYYFTTSLIITGKLMNLLVNERKPSFSRFLPEYRKKELTAIPFKLNDLPLPCSLRFRSSALDATTAGLLEEFSGLKSQFKQILKDKEVADSGQVLYPGQHAVYVFLTPLDKNSLDDIRNTVTPTINGHHVWRGGSERLSNHVTLLEKIIASVPDSAESIQEIFHDYLLEELSESNGVEIFHWKPNGSYYRLGTAEVISCNRDILVLQREVYTRGVYDGLNVEKEPGDLIRTEVPVKGEWWLKHEYFSRKGDSKGVYFNINTPVELDFRSIRYFDLIVDVVKRPGEPGKIIDLEELEELVEQSIVSKKLQERIMMVAEELKTAAEKHDFQKLAAG